MRLRTRFYIYLSAVAAFMIFASYLILDVPASNGETESDTPHDSRAHSKDQFDRSTRNLIQTLSHKYRPKYRCSSSLSSWKLAESWVTPRHIFPDYASENELGCILKALATAEITHADVGYKGTQLKLTLILQGGQRAVFKPKWYDEDYVMVGPPYAGKDRHYAEIAAFHLGRILDMRKSPIVVRRRINLRTEVLPRAHKTLADTFYRSPDGKDTCFYGKCFYCKGPETGVCADGDVLDGVLVLWLPEAYALSRPIHHPWARTYRDGVQAKWEYMENFCKLVKSQPQYSSGPTLLDLVDVAVFDYLIGNADRHHYETFDASPDSMVVMLDNGKSFGTPYHSESTILAPLYQCCIIRKKTVQRLAELAGGVLGRVLGDVLLYTDPTMDPSEHQRRPLLTDLHLRIVDKRLQHVLGIIDSCLDAKRGGANEVLIEDGLT